MSCDRCVGLMSGRRIRQADELKRAILKARDGLDCGLLRYEGAGRDGDPFAALAKGEHWGDFVSNYFSCSHCGQLFHLHAETYHGAGGAFEKVAAITEPLQGDAYEP